MGNDPDDIARLRKEFELAGARAKLASLDEERDRVYTLFPELAPKKYRRTEPTVVFDAEDVGRHGISNQPRRHSKYPPQLRAKAIAMGRRGLRTKDIAARLSAKHAIVDYWLRAAGVKKAAPSERGKFPRPPKQSRYTDEFRNAAVERTRREPIRAVARDLGINDSLLHKWRARAGISGTATKKITRDKPAPKSKAKTGAPSPQAAWERIQRPALAFLVENGGQARSVEIAEKFKCSTDAAGHRGRTLVRHGWATSPTPGVYLVSDKGRAHLEQAE